MNGDGNRWRASAARRSQERVQPLQTFAGKRGDQFAVLPETAPAVVAAGQKLLRHPFDVRAEAGASGEIWLKSPSLVRGYWEKPEATAQTFVDGWAVVTKLAGLALTILAACQGAPFWFDVLKRVANLRATGPAPRPGS